MYAFTKSSDQSFEQFRDSSLVGWDRFVLCDSDQHSLYTNQNRAASVDRTLIAVMHITDKSSVT